MAAPGGDVLPVVACQSAIEQIRNFNFAKTLLLIGPDDYRTKAGETSTKPSNGPMVTILSCSQLAEGRDLAEEAIIINSFLPSGISVCGLFVPESSSAPLSSYVTDMFKGDIAKKLFPSGEVKLLYTNEEDEQLEEQAGIYELESGQRRSCDLKIVKDGSSFTDNVLMFRVRSEVTMKCCYQKKTELPDVFLRQYSFLKNQLQSSTTLYHIQNTSVLVGIQAPTATADASSDSRIAAIIGPLAPSNSIRDVLQQIQEEEEDDGFGVSAGKGGGAKKSKKAKLDGQVLDVRILFRTGSGQVQEANEHIPIVKYNAYATDMHHLAMNLPLDVLVMAPSSAPISYLAPLFIEGVCRQLRAMEICIARHYMNHGICKPEPHHFKPLGLGHLLTVIYPRGVADKDLESTRQSLHQQFILPQDRPLLRRQTTYAFPEDTKDQVLLRNVHVGLPPSGVAGGQPSLVYGVYAYHHYMQDKFNDNGWGCAYRSLQTLCSWFRLQGYVDHSIPSHREIQQTLVDVGDKPNKFIGTKEWIGSIEVSTVLNQLLGVTSKILFVPNGEEMATKGRELALHFQTQGTPVMIGGSSYAHTILGVDFSEKTGDLKFLVLDPHYTGEENLKTIQDKGWCGWKGVDFWDKAAYYNMCLPQRPHEL